MKRWSKRELKVLYDFAGQSIQELKAMLPDRSPSAILTKRSSLKLTPSTQWDVSGDLQKCISCEKLKPNNEFDSRKEGRAGIRTICKDCRRIKARRRNSKNIKDWYKWLKNRYPDPHCQICDVRLQWKAGVNAAPNFDHRHEGVEPIQCNPMSFCANHTLSDENIRKWELSDFGILCGMCNRRLPTKSRGAWLQKACEYERKRL